MMNDINNSTMNNRFPLQTYNSNNNYSNNTTINTTYMMQDYHHQGK
jgi:hypothetical protein